jgi:hypothetical protein
MQIRAARIQTTARTHTDMTDLKRRSCLSGALTAAERWKAALYRCGTEQPIEAVLKDHAFMPVLFALDAILGQVAFLGKEPDNSVLAFGCRVDEPIGQELYALSYHKLMF